MTFRFSMPPAISVITRRSFGTTYRTDCCYRLGTEEQNAAIYRPKLASRSPCRPPPARRLTRLNHDLLGRGDQPRPGADGRIYSIRPSRDPFSEETAPAELWSMEPDDSDARKDADLGGFRLLTFGYDLLPDGDVIWSKFVPGRKELWLAELVEE